MVSDEDEAAEMEDEAVRSRVQHKPTVRGGVAGGKGGGSSPGALPHHYPPSPRGMFALSGFSMAAIQTLCPLCLLLSVSLGFWLSQCPPAPTSESNPGLPMAPRRTSSG